MIGYILTEEEKEQIQGQFYAPYEFFNCVPDINGVWFLFLTEDDKTKVAESEYSWLLDCPEGEYVPPAPQPITLPE